MKSSSEPPVDPVLKDQVKDLRERSKAPWAQNKEETSYPKAKSFSYGRVGVEFVSGIIAGVLLGLGIDSFFGIAPWGIILFFILGSCAGFYNVYRVIKRKS